MSTRRGFTLLELLAVVTLLAILAAVATVRLGDPRRAAMIEHAMARFIALEHQLRHHARRVGRPAELVIDFSSGLIERTELDERPPVGPAVRLAGGVRIDRFLSAAIRGQDYGTARTYVSAEGQTRTYAVHFRGPAESGRWLIIAGVTGQARHVENEDDVKKTLGLLSQAGIYAD